MKEFKHWLVSDEQETNEDILAVLDIAKNQCPLAVNVDPVEHEVYIKQFQNVLILSVEEFLQIADYVRKKSTEA